ncbi:MAG TPA: penicillin-binding transpeptidase domain-containing protein [Verrucomicrobiae bacterium]|nr:penicillin-binding transpeptidase domain-containing protein [Verrucomicrobiae bacterium]
MLRREAIALLLAASRASAALLGRFFGSAPGAAILVDIGGRKVLGVHNPELAGQAPAPPGSTLKPLVLTALLSRGAMGADESFPCPGRLTIAGHSLDCSHPRLAVPVRPRTAIAYSCNAFVAHMAARFAPGDLARELERYGLRAPSGLLSQAEAAGRIREASTPGPVKLQALGEQGVEITLAELAQAYRQLAQQLGDASLRPILEGLEDAVDYGTAQRAKVLGVTVAGKTGSVRTAAGKPLAWFTGFAPSRSPEVVVAVLLQGYSGGSDAAPIGGRILEAWHSGKL